VHADPSSEAEGLAASPAIEGAIEATGKAPGLALFSSTVKCDEQVLHTHLSRRVSVPCALSSCFALAVPARPLSLPPHSARGV
jgi:hypothetical protein